MLVVLTENRGLEKNGIPALSMEVTATLFMKPCEEVVEVLSGLTDRRVGQTLEAIQAVRKRDSASKGAPSAADAENARESRGKVLANSQCCFWGCEGGDAAGQRRDHFVSQN